jgi:signal transduction histidine kinase
MNLNLERSPNAMVSESASSRELLMRSAGQVQRPSRHSEQQQSRREWHLRLEERRNERRRIARELHDTLFQGFLGASLLLQGAVEQTPADSPTKPSLSRALRMMYRVINEGRVALQDLRSSPSNSPTLEEALHELWDELTPAGVQFRILVEGQPKSLAPELREQIYMIGREAVLNALHHSGAASVEAEIEYSSRRLRLIVRDNGCGIDPEVLRSGRDSHWGLLGMRERATKLGAQLRIWSRLGGGTEVELSVPIHFARNAHAQLSSPCLDPRDQRRWADA